MDDRLARERHFHDELSNLQRRKRAAGKYYSITQSATDYYENELLSFNATLPVLEYGCGPGSHAFFLAERGYHVTGIDISEAAIAQALASALTIPGKTRFLVMNAEDLSFPNHHFGGICAQGVLHHLDIDRAASEISRVLAPNGKAVFLEPLGHNALINLYRRLTPQLRTVDEHPLLARDIEKLKLHFTNVKCRYFYLTTIAAAPLHRMALFRALVRGLEFFDRSIFTIVPGLRKYAWIAVITVSNR